MSGGKVALLVVGILVALLGFGTAVAGAGMLWADSTQRGSDGYLESPTWALETEHAALTAEEIHIGAPAQADRWWFRPIEIRLEVASTTPGQVFVGIGPRGEVDDYLGDVPHSEITRLGATRGASYRYRAGDASPASPGTQGFWVAQAQGPGTQTLTWLAEPGTWALVVMNADGEPGVSVQARAAARVDFLGPLGIGLLALGVILLLAAVGMVLVATVRPDGSGPTQGPSGRTTHAGAAVPDRSGSPVRIEGRLEAPLSRWLWLVKWVLLLPHAVVLIVLWTAFVLLTVVAGIAILASGRYPRGIFDLNVGIIRWTWRVVYYGYAALGTDQYPPFSLDAADYPARLDIAYPPRLSRGLVLVKWWLLALPHYIVVAVFAGGGFAWTTSDRTWGTWSIGAGGGVIGVLVIVAGILLLFTARYPQGLFDVVMGLNRWVYRVLAYAALMTDEYPPFRLDLGGGEPAPEPAPPAGPTPADAHPERVRT